MMLVQKSMPHGHHWVWTVRHHDRIQILITTILIFILDRALAVPDELASASGLTKDQVRINPKYGGGYPANVEGLHHLHCLNLLRKGLKWNYDYYRNLGEGAFSNDEYIAKYHISKPLFQFFYFESDKQLIMFFFFF